jgi:hypothetical protein
MVGGSPAWGHLPVPCMHPWYEQVLAGPKGWYLASVETVPSFLCMVPRAGQFQKLALTLGSGFTEAPGQWTLHPTV